MTMAVYSKLPEGSDIMKYITLSELLQFTTMLIAFAGLLYNIFRNKKK